MKLKSLKEADIEGKIVLYRSPYDIKTKKINGKYEITDDSRIRATLPTLDYLLKKNCRIVILTYVKRPDGKVVESLKTDPHARSLSNLLNRSVDKIDECVGKRVRSRISEMQSRDILMLENTRFHPEEMIDDDNFAKELAQNGELVVFDAFPQSQRIHASVTGIQRHLPSVAGFYIEKEINGLSKLLQDTKRPYTVIIGGAKISDKIDAINNLYDIADTILVGGGVANVFLKAQGKKMGDSFIEDIFVDKVKKEKKDWVEYAREILRKKLGKIIVPYDLIITDSLDNSSDTKVLPIGKSSNVVPDKWAALDIGPKTRDEFKNIISESKTVFWNGPMGVFEDDRFAGGSKVIAEAMCNMDGRTVVAGGDTIEALKTSCDPSKVNHVSLAGGASLEFLAGKELPGLVPLILK